MGPQRDRRQVSSVGAENQLLGACLGRRIGGLEGLRIGNTLIHTLHVQSIENHAGRAAVDDSPRTVRSAGLDHVASTHYIRSFVFMLRAPDARLCRGVKDCSATSDCTPDHGRVGDVTLYLLDPKVVKMLVPSPGQAPNSQTAPKQA